MEAEKYNKTMEDVSKFFRGQSFPGGSFSVNGSEPRPVFGNLPVKQSTSAVTSPYDEGLKRTLRNKLLDNRVHVPWYRTYKLDLPSEEITDYQPFDEIQRQDENIALQYFYGERYLLFQDFKDPHVKQQRLAILRMYNKKKEKDFAAQTFLPISSASKLTNGNMVQLIYTSWLIFYKISYLLIWLIKKRRSCSFGPTFNEKQMLMPVIDYFNKIHTLRKRQFLARSILKPNSKWNLLKKPHITSQLNEMAKAVKKLLAKRKFLKTVHLVLNVQKFLAVITTMIIGDTESMFKKDKEYTEAADSFRMMLSRKGDGMKEKKIFNSQKYKLNKEIGVPLSVKFSLTKPWFRRTEKEVDEIVQCFQRLKSFVEYPVTYQRLIGRAAWLMELPKYKVVIREGQKAYSFYFVVTGKLKMTHLIGDPYHGKYSEFQKVATIKAQDTFGEECIARPYSKRKFSVVTEEPTILLSVNIHELYKMELEVKDHEEAPEHIKFLSTLSFLETFPKSKLKEEADENIMLFYFRPNTVITPDAASSEFVYVISWGTCQVLVEIPPNAKVIYNYIKSEKERLEMAARVCFRRKSSAYQLIDLMKIKQEELVAHSRQSTVGNMTLNSLEPLMIKADHKKALELDKKKLEKRLAKFKDQMNYEVNRLTNKTTRAIAAIKRKSHKLPDFMDEWHERFQKWGIQMPEEFFKPPVNCTSDLGIDDLEEKDTLFDDLININVALSNEEMKPEREELPPEKDLESLDPKETAKSNYYENITVRKIIPLSAGLQIDITPAGGKKVDNSERLKKFEPYKQKTRKEHGKSGHRKIKKKHLNADHKLNKLIRPHDNKIKDPEFSDAKSSETESLDSDVIQSLRTSKKEAAIEKFIKNIKKKPKAKWGIHVSKKKTITDQRTHKLGGLRANKHEVKKVASAELETSKHETLKQRKGEKIDSVKNVHKRTKEQTNNNIQADPVDQKTSRDKLPKMLLSRNAVSTMPEITEISADSVRHLDSSVTDESVLSTATLSRNNSNIKSDLDVPPENREERKG
ncbi:hypothetical protein Btru_001692, partial [Bulinus truncatus]